MNLLVRTIQVHVPAFIRRKKLLELFDLTAAAFRGEAPVLEGLGYEECLLQYAQFTRQEAEKAIQQGCDREAKGRLYQSALQMGQNLRKSFRISTTADAMDMARILYRGLRIDFSGTSQGEITIRRCFFSQFYSSVVCDVISALDSGVMAGLAGGGQLVFSQRITEGKDCCKACLMRPREGRF